MPETNALLNHDLENHAGDDFEHEEMSSTKKVALYTGTFVSGAFCLWVLCFLLPNLYIPEAVDLKPFARVADVPVFLVPIESKASQSYSHIHDVSPAVSENFVTIDTTIEKTSSKTPIERIIMIGDIHGHLVELKKLLKKAHYNSDTDHVLMLGDFISKGDFSIEVIEFAIEQGFGCILGNHELYVLQYYASFHGIKGPVFENYAANDKLLSAAPNLAKAEGAYNDDPEYLLAKKLQPKHVEFINQCSLIKSLGQVPLHKSSVFEGKKSALGVAVHAGLRWDIPDLVRQPPVECLEMRSYVGPYYNETTSDPHAPNAVSWSKIWNQKQKELPESDAKVVYYGHDARRGLNVKKYAKGLDSGCDRGDKLTAIAIWQETFNKRTGGESILFKDQYFSVKCS